MPVNIDIFDSANQKFDPGVSGMSSNNAQDGIIEAYNNTGSGGEANSGANVGTGQGESYRDKVGTVLNFKRLSAGTDIGIQNNADNIVISYTGGGIGEAPNDQNRTYFRDGTAGDWTKSLKGYGEVEQSTGASGNLTIQVGDGNRIYSGLSSAVTSITLQANITVMDCTWLLQHNGNNVTFPSSFKFSGGTAPDGSSGNAWLMGLFTRDGGTNWVVSYVEDYTL